MAQDSVPAGSGPSPYHDRRWWILGIVVFGLVVVILDTTVLNVALKTIADPRKGIGASQTALEWALNSYTLAFASLLITFGSLGDRIGHRRMLVGGMTVFALGSLLSAYATSAAELVGGRTIMGIGGAAILPATLAVIAHVFTPQERPKAIGIWGASVGLGAGVGPIVGGLLLEHFWWGSVFLVNVLVAVVAIPVMLALVPESRSPNPSRLDPVGVLLSVLGMIALVYGIIRGGDLGTWTGPSVIGPIAGGLAVLALFAFWESRAASPAIDVRLFLIPRFSAAVGALLLAFVAAMGSLFFVAFYLQSVHGLTPALAGVWMLPFAAAQIIFAPRSARLVRKFGARGVCVAGTIILTASFVPFAFMSAATPLWVFGVVFFVQGVGLAHLVAPTTEVVMGSVPRAKAGAGSAVSNTGRQIGGALGVAILGSVLATVYRTGVTPALDRVGGLSAAAKSQIGGSITATQGYVEQHLAGHGQLGGLLPAASAAFIHAMHTAAVGCAVAAGLSAVTLLVWMPRQGAQRAQQAPAAPAEPATKTSTA